VRDETLGVISLAITRQWLVVLSAVVLILQTRAAPLFMVRCERRGPGLSPYRSFSSRKTTFSNWRMTVEKPS
jgi:hypothetical protein